VSLDRFSRKREDRFSRKREERFSRKREDRFSRKREDRFSRKREAIALAESEKRSLPPKARTRGGDRCPASHLALRIVPRVARLRRASHPNGYADAPRPHDPSSPSPLVTLRFAVRIRTRISGWNGEAAEPCCMASSVRTERVSGGVFALKFAVRIRTQFRRCPVARCAAARL